MGIRKQIENPKVYKRVCQDCGKTLAYSLHPADFSDEELKCFLCMHNFCDISSLIARTVKADVNTDEKTEWPYPINYDLYSVDENHSEIERACQKFRSNVIRNVDRLKTKLGI